MSGTDHINGQGFYFIDGFQQEFAVGFQDHIEIVIKCICIIFNKVIHHLLIGIVGSERVAAKNEAILLKVGVNGIGPVKVRSTNDLQFFISQVDYISVFYLKGIKRMVYHLAQVSQCLSASYNSGVWSQFKQVSKRSGMIGFGMVANDVFDLTRIGKREKFLFILRPECLFYSIDNCFFSALIK